MAISRETEVFESDARRLNDGPLERVLLEAFGKVNVRTVICGVTISTSSTVTCTTTTALDIVGSFFQRLLDAGAVEAVIIGVKGAECGPVNTSGCTANRSNRKCTVIDEGRELIAHAIGECGLFKEIHPRAGVQRTCVDVLSDTVRLFGENGVQSGYARTKIK